MKTSRSREKHQNPFGVLSLGEAVERMARTGAQKAPGWRQTGAPSPPPPHPPTCQRQVVWKKVGLLLITNSYFQIPIQCFW